MKINSNVKIVGKTVVLVPYRKEHVPRYHSWMESDELRTLTASERLTLEEEHQMQQSWFADEDKCTFIILDADKHRGGASDQECMIGDTNLFLSTAEDDPGIVCGENEVMIAEPTSRGRGMGKEAVLMMIHYGVTQLSISVFVAKIGTSNTRSLQLFRNIGFVEVGVSEVFQEVSLELRVTNEFRHSLSDILKHISVAEYESSSGSSGDCK